MSLTLAVYQGMVNKHVLILSTMHKDITVADKTKKTTQAVSSYRETNYRVDMQYLNKWLRNTLAELLHKGDQCVISKTHCMLLLSMPGFSMKKYLQLTGGRSS